MAKGKQTPPETVYKVMASFAVTQNLSETARNLKLSVSTVKKIVQDNKNKPEFVKLCNEKKADFADKASEIIDKGLKLLDRRISTALEHENELDILIDEIFATDKEEMSDKEKMALVTKIRGLQLQKMGDITTAIGTLYDKRALAKGENTENTQVTIKLPEGFEKYGG